MPAGETDHIAIAVVDEAGAPVDLSGGQLLFTVKTYPTDVSPVISRQATIDYPTLGLAYFPLLAADTLLRVGALGYDVWWTGPGPNENRQQIVPFSPFFVTPGLGQPDQAVTVPDEQFPLALGPPGVPIVSYATSGAFPDPTAQAGRFAWALNTSALFVAEAGSWHAIGGAATSITNVQTHGTLFVGSVTQDATSNLVTKYQPAEAGSLPWVHWFNQSDNPGGWARKDQISRFGWNVAAGGGLLITGDRIGGFSWEFESSFRGSNDQMESHWVYWKPIGGSTRILSALSNLNAPYGTQLFINAETINVGPVGGGSVSIGPTTAGMASPNVGAIPATLSTVFVDDTQAWIKAGTNKASAIAFANGEFDIHSDTNTVIDVGGQGHLNVSGTVVWEWGAGFTAQFAPHLMIGVDASGGNPTQPSQILYLRGNYWTGSASQFYDVKQTLIVDTTAPTAHMLWEMGGSNEVMRLSGAGVLGVSVTSGNTAALSLKNGASATVSAAGEVKLRSNAGVFEISANGGAYAAPGGGGSTVGLNAAYQGAASASDNVILTSAAKGLVQVRDNASAIGNIFQVTDSAGSANYFSVAPNSIQINTGASGQVEIVAQAKKIIYTGAALVSNGSGDITLGLSNHLFGSMHTGTSSYILWHADTTNTNFVALNAPAATAQRVWTLQDATDTVVGRATTDTLTGKTMSGASNTFSAIPESAITNLTTDLAAKAPTTRTLTAGTGITGGGDLSADRSFAVNQAFTPTWTGAHVWQQATTTTQVLAATFGTSTAATVGAQKFSTYTEWLGSGWATTPVAAQPVGWGFLARPLQGAANPDVEGVWYANINGSRTEKLKIWAPPGSGTLLVSPAAFTLRESVGNNGVYIDNAVGGAGFQIGAVTKFLVTGNATVNSVGWQPHRVAVADTNYTVLNTDHIIAYSSLTATRTITLPLANSVTIGGSGRTFILIDESGSAAAGVKLSLARSGSDTINGATSFDAVTSAWGGKTIVSDGVSKWTVY